jgi:Mn2+/Fe2+ NRAMP family transporter
MADDVKAIAELPWYRRLGPGLITAALVLGPGSIVAASAAGAKTGYRFVWILVIASLIMGVYTSMAARIGCALSESESILRYITRVWGRPVAVLTGVCSFVVAAGFQFSNNIAVSAAMEGIAPIVPTWIWPIVFTVLSLIFLITAQSIYRIMEIAMQALVAVMLLAFLGNLWFTGVSLPAMGAGLVPRAFGPGDFLFATSLFATTYSAVASFYQAYLVQEKGWNRETVRYAIEDAWAGIVLLGIISIVIMAGAAESLHGKVDELKNVGQLAGQLRDVLGNFAALIFCFGLAAAAFSPFIINTLIGGSLLVDGFGFDAHLSSKATRITASIALVIGCVIAVMTMLGGGGGPNSVLLAQVFTVVVSPLCALLTLFFANSKDLMGDLKNGVMSNVIGVFGFVMVTYLASQTFMEVFASLAK